MPGRKQEQKNTSRDLIILAMGPTKSQCPYNTEVWAVNNGYKQIREDGKRIDKLFLAHAQVKDEKGNDIFNWEEIDSLGIDVINTHKVKGLNSRLFPMKRIIKKFGCDYFSDTICYMIAYALDQVTRVVNGEVKLKYPMQIRMYGADMYTTDEYEKEKGGIEYWIGYARGLGIKVEVSIGSALLRNQSGKPYGQKVRIKDQDIVTETLVNDFLSSATGVYVGAIPDDVVDIKCYNVFN